MCIYVQGEDKHFELPVNKKTDVCTIMYTSGTTGEPKGVMISNNSIVTLIAGVKCFLESFNETVSKQYSTLTFSALYVVSNIKRNVLHDQINLK